MSAPPCLAVWGMEALPTWWELFSYLSQWTKIHRIILCSGKCFYVSLGFISIAHLLKQPCYQLFLRGFPASSLKDLSQLIFTEPFLEHQLAGGTDLCDTHRNWVDQPLSFPHLRPGLCLWLKPKTDPDASQASTACSNPHCLQWVTVSTAA